MDRGGASIEVFGIRGSSLGCSCEYHSICSFIAAWDAVFRIKIEEIKANNYDLALNSYKEVVHENIKHIPSKKIISDLKKIENDIQKQLSKLEELIK